MKNKLIFGWIVIITIVFLIIVYPNVVYGSTVTDAMAGMAGGGTGDTTGAAGKLGPLINTVIGLIQITGTGLSLIMVTILGIKYILSAPSDKADVKKQITPLVIGCVILFASVNLVQIIANFATTTLSKAAG